MNCCSPAAWPLVPTCQLPAEGWLAALVWNLHSSHREDWEQENKRKHSKDIPSCCYANPDSSKIPVTASECGGLHIIRIFNIILNDTPGK